MRSVRGALLAAACAGACGPSTGDLRGSWLVSIDGVHRAFVFAAASDARPELAGERDVYLRYRYPFDQDPVVVETGRYHVDDGDLVTAVLWDETSLRVGQTLRAGLDDWDDDHFTLADPAQGPLRFTRVGDLPRRPGQASRRR